MKNLFRLAVIISVVIGVTGCATTPPVIPPEFLAQSFSDVRNDTIVILPMRDFRESSSDGIFKQPFGKEEPAFVRRNLKAKGWNTEFSEDKTLYRQLTAKDLELLDKASSEGQSISSKDFLGRFEKLEGDLVLITSVLTAENTGSIGMDLLLGYESEAAVVGYLVDFRKKQVLWKAANAFSGRGPLLFGFGKGVSIRMAIEKNLEILTHKFPMN